MKKQVLITILFAMLTSMPMFAYDFVQGGIYYNIEGDHVSVTYSGNGVYSGNVSIPNQVTYGGVTYPVTAIGEWAFEGGEGITYLYIPSSITSIGEYAFIDCGSNIEVRIADLTAWCKVEFGNEHSSPLSSAKKLYLNTNYETTSLSIPNGVETISNFAFYQCRSITSLSIAGSVKSIGSSAFEDCTGLTSICLSEGVESVGGSSFEGCTGLSTIILPSTLSSIALNAFKNCSNLNTIVSRIQEPFAFVDNVFSTYPTATVIVPEGTTSAYQSTGGWNLFDNITDDSSQDPTKRTIQVATAGTLPSLISAEEKYIIEELTLTGELNGTDIRFIREMVGQGLGDSGDRWDDERFSYFTTSGILKKLDITNVSIVAGGGLYYGINRGSSYPVSYGTSNNSVSSYMFNKCQLTSVKLPTNVTSIGSYAFSGCSGLTYVTIPNSVTSIGDYAFYGCSGLTSVTIPNSVTSIGDDAFYKCSGLTSVTIPNSVTSIGDYAFRNCSSLTSVTIPNSVTSIGSEAFKNTGWYNLQGDGILYLDNWLVGYKGEKPIGELVITDGTKGIADYAFSGCSGLTSVSIANSVTSIGGSAFYGCSGLTSVTIPNSVASIGGDAFRHCSGLTSVIIPNSVTTIGERTFYNCSGLTSVTIPNSVTIIDSDAFYGCSGLISIIIPNSVTIIGYEAFDGCSGLTSVTIGNSVTTIAHAAFQICNGLTSILSLNDTPPTCNGSIVFNNVDKEDCVVWVPKGSATAYKDANVWKDFQNIKEIVDYDLNLDEKVNRNDQNTLVAHIMGEKPEGLFEGLADLNGDDDVNAADVVTLVDILNNAGLSTETEFGYDNVDGSLVVSSLTCTLNNERDEAILLTRCELYSNGSLLKSKSYSSNPISVAAGGNKSCTFENLSKPANGTAFTVCWHYTVNDESFVYRCPLID